jgi:hypothetical protein
VIPAECGRSSRKEATNDGHLQMSTIFQVVGVAIARARKKNYMHLVILGTFGGHWIDRRVHTNNIEAYDIG